MSDTEKRHELMVRLLHRRLSRFLGQGTQGDWITAEKLARGLSISAIALEEGIDPWDIRERLLKLRQQAGVETNEALVAWAIDEGYITRE